MSEYSREQFLKIIKKGGSLEGTDLSGIDLSSIDFIPKPQGIFNNKITFTKCNLNNADLSKSSFFMCDFRNVQLKKANLRASEHFKSDFDSSDLNESNLSRANFHICNFNKANLRKSNIIESTFNEVNMINANMSNSVLSRSVFYNSNLSNVVLRKSKLINTIFNKTQLEFADFNKTYLESTDFENSVLTEVDISGSNIQNIKTIGWKIDGIICTHIFYCPDLNSFNTRQRNRYKRNLFPGQFEELYKCFPTIEMIFKGGITSKEYLKLIGISELIRQENPSIYLQIKSLEKVGLEAILRFTLNDDKYLDEVTRMIARFYIDQSLENKLLPILKNEGIELSQSFPLENVSGITILAHKLTGETVKIGDIANINNIDDQTFIRKYKIIIKPGIGIQRGFLIIDDIEIKISPIELDICITMYNRLKKDWFKLDPLDSGWVSDDMFRKEVKKWNFQEENGEPIGEGQVTKRINLLNKKIAKELRFKNNKEYLIQGTKRSRFVGCYRFRVHPECISVVE